MKFKSADELIAHMAVCSTKPIIANSTLQEFIGSIFELVGSAEHECAKYTLKATKKNSFILIIDKYNGRVEIKKRTDKGGYARTGLPLYVWAGQVKMSNHAALVVKLNELKELGVVELNPNQLDVRMQKKTTRTTLKELGKEILKHIDLPISLTCKIRTSNNGEYIHYKYELINFSVWLEKDKLNLHGFWPGKNYHFYLSDPQCFAALGSAAKDEIVIRIASRIKDLKRTIKETQTDLNKLTKAIENEDRKP